MIMMMRQDDPHKCTALKLVRFGLAQSIKFIPKKSLVLNPFSDIRLVKRDMLLSESLCVIDCSWEDAIKVWNQKDTRIHGIDRRLPALLAANPINYAKLGKLSTAEALAGSHYILGNVEMARNITNKFKWGHTFLELNLNLLDDYAKADSSEKVMEIEKEYFPQLT